MYRVSTYMPLILFKVKFYLNCFLFLFVNELQWTHKKKLFLNFALLLAFYIY